MFALMLLLGAVAADDSIDSKPAAKKPAAKKPAAKKPAAKKPAAKKPADSISGWIEDLQARSFRKRQDATKHLFRAGQRALPALIRAAETSTSREVVTRSIEVLQRHRKEGGSESKSTATEALRRIEKCPNKMAARRAHEILHPKPPTPVNPFGPRIFAGRVVIQGRVIGGRRFRVVRVVGGRQAMRSVIVNDGKQKVSIHMDANGIRVEVTTLDAGKKAGVKKYSAKSVAELKKKHPEAYKLFQKHMAGGKRPVIRIAPAVPGRGIRPAGKPPEIKRLEKATRRLQKIVLPAPGRAR